jgi:PHP family Zn ribbon phosphoesterase
LRVIADLHIHSKYSRATSAKLTPPYLDHWAGVKGITLLGSGDCTHPVWLRELRDNLDDAEEGFFTLKKGIRRDFCAGPVVEEALPVPEQGFLNEARFVLTGEISTIYKKGNKTRKIHHVVILPDFKAAAAFQIKLEQIGNIRSDGRPILGLDSRDLLAMLLEADDRSILIPAHIWTPWFSALGANSGFDSIQECYGDLTPFIPAVETGLSSNPPMNWALESLDGFSIVSSSDAHSPDKLGREAAILEMELSYTSFAKSLRDKSQRDRILDTI